MANLAAYFQSIKSKEVSAGKPRKEIRLVSHKYSHHEELDERLHFLQMYAANSNFAVTKQHLKVVYDMLACSPVKSDLDQFLRWCKKACENLTDQIVDLNEIGEFFSEQIAQGVLDLKSMPPTGFHFVQMFFVSANINAGKILSRMRPQKKIKKKKKNEWTNFYSLWDEPEKQEPDANEDADQEAPYFANLQDPAQLLHMHIIWSIVLESEVKEVYEPAINLLVHSHLSFYDEKMTSEEQRIAYLSAFLAKCFELIQPESNPSTHIVNRVTQIIKEVI